MGTFIPMLLIRKLRFREVTCFSRVQTTRCQDEISMLFATKETPCELTASVSISPAAGTVTQAGAHKPMRDLVDVTWYSRRLTLGSHLTPLIPKFPDL